MKKKMMTVVLALVTAAGISACGGSGSAVTTAAAAKAGTAAAATTAKAPVTTAAGSTATTAKTSAAATASKTSAGQAASAGKSASGKTTITLAAAASLKNVFDKTLIPAFEKKNPDIKIEATYDSSGKLQTQIEQGLAADIFFSAAEKQMKALDDEGKIDSKSTVKLLKNQLVMIVPKNSTADLKKFDDCLTCKTIAIGDPESVPAGQYAKEALTSLGLYDKAEAKFSKGTNVTEVLNWVAEGSAEVGFVYATDAASVADKVKVICAAPEGSLKNQVIYPVALLKDAPQKTAAAKFLDYLKSDEAMKAFTEFGFTDNRGK